MLYCQQCGAGNVSDARFCNMCGTPIAAPGEPGGPLPATEVAGESTLHGHGGAKRDVSVSASGADEKPPKKKQRGGTQPGHAEPGSAAVDTLPEASAPSVVEPAAMEDRAAGTRARAAGPSPRETDPDRAGRAAAVAPRSERVEREDEERATDSDEDDAYDGRDSSPSVTPRRARADEGFDVSTLSLSAMGVRSPAKAWGTLIGIALLLVGLGAFGAWIAMRGDEEPEAVAEVTDPVPAEPEVPEDVIVGDPIPEGEVPDVVAGTPEPSGRRGATSGRGGPAGRTGSTGGSSGTGSTGSSGTGGTTGSTGSTGGTTGSTGGTGGTTGSTGGTGGTTGSTGGSTGGTGGSAGGTGGSAGGTGGSTGGTERDWGAMETARDREMDAYANSVRSFIRTYYIQRASSCFEHESRNTESVRGTVVIGFEIPADGQVRSARVVRNTTGSDALGGCLARQVGGWRLPAPPTGEAPLPMQMPFSR